MGALHRLPPPAREAIDAELVSALVAGEHGARERFYHRYVKMVYGMACRLEGRGSAEDVTQDVFIEAFTCLHRLERPEALRSWLGGITVRIIRRRRERFWLRRRLLRQWKHDVSNLINECASPDVALELKDAYEKLGQLPDRLRLAFLLRRIEGMKLEEIAIAMEASLSTVKRWLVEAEARLEQLERRRFGGSS